MTALDSLHSLLYYERLRSRCDWLVSDLRIGNFFHFRCPLVNTPQLNTQLLHFLTTEWLNSRKNSRIKDTWFSEPLSLNGLFRVYLLPQGRVLI
jgi:hypothetical protein